MIGGILESGATPCCLLPPQTSIQRQLFGQDFLPPEAQVANDELDNCGHVDEDKDSDRFARHQGKELV